MAVFCADGNVGAFDGFQSGVQIHEGNTGDHIAVCIFYQRLDGLEQLFGFSGGLIHFPVAGDNGFSKSFVHENSISFILMARCSGPVVYRKKGRGGISSAPLEPAVKPSELIPSRSGRQCREAHVPPGIPEKRRRRWRCGSSCRHSQAFQRQPQSRRRR